MSHRRRWRADNPDVVVCTPPSRWANPYRVAPVPSGTGVPTCRWGVWKDGQLVEDFETGITASRNLTQAARLKIASRTAKRMAATCAVQLFSYDLYTGRLSFTVDDLRAELAGRTLACRCPEWDKTMPCPRCHGNPITISVDGFGFFGACPLCHGIGLARWPCHVDVELIAANPDSVPLYGWAKTTWLAASDRLPDYCKRLPDRGGRHPAAITAGPRKPPEASSTFDLLTGYFQLNGCGGKTSLGTLLAKKETIR